MIVMNGKKTLKSVKILLKFAVFVVQVDAFATEVDFYTFVTHKTEA